MADPAPRTRIPPDAEARFTAAEARLYPLVMVDPDAYQRAVTLTGILLKDLRSTCPDIDSVLRRRDGLQQQAAGQERDGHQQCDGTQDRSHPPWTAQRAEVSHRSGDIGVAPDLGTLCP